jgi:SHS2 domain-containing protein
MHPLHSPQPSQGLTTPADPLSDSSGDADAYFEHGADIGVIGRGPTIEAAFEACAAATFAIQVDLAQVHHVIAVEVDFEEADVELALVQWINQLLGAARRERAVFSAFSLRRTGHRWVGSARGEAWRDAHERGTEVKGATLTELSVRRVGPLWEARCVVDV